MIVLGIETSCDETSASIVENGIVLTNKIYSQQIHKKYGGVVPDLASKDHEKNIYNIVLDSINDAGIKLLDIDVIAVTFGSGLLSSLIVGLNFAKGLSIGLNIPIIAINHLEGHLCSSIINNKFIKYPYMSLIVSGGHTQIWYLKDFNDYKVISNTVDDAVGEAFDKGARILGLGYPGGPEIEKKAKYGDAHKFKFSIPNVKNNNLSFSFSGLKTALLYKKNKLDDLKEKYSINDLAASYQNALINTLFDKLNKALKLYKVDEISIVGGVSANKKFREKAVVFEKDNNVKIIFPSMEYCTDNAAMIAMAGYLKYKNNETSNLDILPNPNISR